MRTIKRIILISAIFTAATGQGSFWYLTDLHYDPTYNDTNESCNEEASGETKGKFGHYECDPPWALIDSSIKEMKNRFEEPKFIIWGGDNGHHAGKNTRFSVDYMAEIMQNVTNLLVQEFPNVIVIPVLGNHDWWPKNQLPDNGDDLYDRYYEMWKQWIPSDQEEHFKKAGFFSLSLDEDKIKMVVLNTNLYLGSNEAASGEDPGGQFAWLTQQLEEARRTGTKVHVITHVPSVLKMMTDEYNKKFVDIIVSYSDAIQVVYGAHLHFDQFSLYFNESGNGQKTKKAVSFMLLLPSISPWRWSGSAYARNPTFRQINYAANGELEDYMQYYLDLPEANQGQPKWERLYTFSETYGKQKITTDTMWSLARDLQNHKSKKWEPYYKYLIVDVGPPYNTPCECECKERELCAIFSDRNDLYGQCTEQIDVTCSTATCCVVTSCLILLATLISLFAY